MFSIMTKRRKVNKYFKSTMRKLRMGEKRGGDWWEEGGGHMIFHA